MTQATEKTMVENAQDKSYKDTENTGENKERLFTQKELEEILSERLKRERKTTKALNDVKRLLKAAAEKGLLGGNSYCEMAEDFCKKLGDKQGDLPKETPDVTENLYIEQGSADALLEEGASAADEAEKLCKEQNVEENQNTNEPFNETKEFAGTLGMLREKFSDKDLGYLLSSGLFEGFAKGREGRLVDVFSDFCEFMSLLPKNENSFSSNYGEQEAIEDDFEDELFSTAFSSDSSSATSYEDGLTKQQMDIAKSAGMSYREYAQLLESIPKNKTRKSY